MLPSSFDHVTLFEMGDDLQKVCCVGCMVVLISTTDDKLGDSDLGKIKCISETSIKEYK